MEITSKQKLYAPSKLYHGNSRHVTVFNVIKATIIKDFKIWKRYRANLIGGIIEVFIFVIMFGIFASAAQFRDSGYTDKIMFIFFLSGILLVIYSNTALWAPLNSVNRDLYNGTLEFIYSNPSNRYAYYVGSVLADAIVRQIFIVPIFVFLVMVSGTSSLNILFIALVLFVVTFVLLSFGVMIAMMAILWKQTGSIVGIMGMLFQFIGGAYFPVQSLPKFAQWLAYLFPFSYGYDLIRYYSFGGDGGWWATIAPVNLMWGILFGFGIFYFFVTLFLLRKVENHSKQKGLHLL